MPRCISDRYKRELLVDVVEVSLAAARFAAFFWRFFALFDGF